MCNPSHQTDAPMASASFASAGIAPARATSSPQTMTGRCAPRINSAMAAIASREASGLRCKVPAVAGVMLVSSSMTLIGRPMNTGPGGPSFATLKARRRIGAISSARSTCTLHFVSGAAIATRSWPSTGSANRMRVSCWPAVTMTGELARMAQ